MSVFCRNTTRGYFKFCKSRKTASNSKDTYFAFHVAILFASFFLLHCMCLLFAFVAYGLIGILLTVVSFLAWKLSLKARDVVLRLLLLSVTSVCIWMLCAHHIVELHYCPRCHIKFLYYRNCEILKIPFLLKVKESSTLAFYIAKDLGFPCQHPKIKKWVVEDQWGLWLAIPYSKEIGDQEFSFLISPHWKEWYHNEVRPKVIQMAREKPELVDLFHNRVLEQQDSDYLQYLCDEVLLFRPYAFDDYE